MGVKTQLRLASLLVLLAAGVSAQSKAINVCEYCLDSNRYIDCRERIERVTELWCFFMAVMVNDEANVVGEKAVDVAQGYVRRNPTTGVQFDLFKRVRANGSDARALLEQRKLRQSIRKEYDASVVACLFVATISQF